MLELMKLVSEIANKLLDRYEDKNSKEIQILVKELFEDVQIIYSNFNEILNKAVYQLRYGEMSVDDCLVYLNNERLPFQAIRAKVRGFIKHPYYQTNPQLINFLLGIIGVLVGGLHDTTSQALDEQMRESDFIIEKYMDIKGYHTIMDIIYLYDKKNKKSLYYAERYKNYQENELEKAIKSRLIEDIEKQIEKIKESWQQTCDYYALLII